MFKDTYKKAMKSVSPREGLLEEILQKAASEDVQTKVKTLPKRKRSFRYAASVAAALVICIGAAAYPAVLKTFNDYENASRSVQTSEKADMQNNENKADFSDVNSENTEDINNIESEDVKILPNTKNENAPESELKEISKKASEKIKTSEKQENTNAGEALPEEKAEDTNSADTEKKRNFLKSAEADIESAQTDNNLNIKSNINQAEKSEADVAASVQNALCEDNSPANGAKGSQEHTEENQIYAVNSALSDEFCESFDYKQDLKTYSDICFTEKKNQTNSMAASAYDALRIAETENKEKYDYSVVYCDSVNAVWRVDFILTDGSTAMRVYVAFDGSVVAIAGKK